jgi:hypothetical protein
MVLYSTVAKNHVQNLPFFIPLNCILPNASNPFHFHTHSPSSRPNLALPCSCMVWDGMLWVIWGFSNEHLKAASIFEPDVPYFRLEISIALHAQYVGVTSIHTHVRKKATCMLHVRTAEIHVHGGENTFLAFMRIYVCYFTFWTCVRYDGNRAQLLCVCVSSRTISWSVTALTILRLIVCDLNIYLQSIIHNADQDQT